jgi:hypothetical protein
VEGFGADEVVVTVVAVSDEGVTVDAARRVDGYGAATGTIL